MSFEVMLSVYLLDSTSFSSVTGERNELLEVSQTLGFFNEIFSIL